MDQIDLRLGQTRDERFIGLDRALEFVDRALANIEEERNEAHPIRQKPNEFLDSAGPHCGLDAANDTAPGCIGHGLFLPLMVTYFFLYSSRWLHPALLAQ